MKVLMIIVLLSGQYYQSDEQYDSLDTCFKAGNELIQTGQALSFVCMIRQLEDGGDDEQSVQD